jgi:hypothetical protein
MTTARLELEPSLQALIDDRLDAIERVLLRAGVARGERRGIVEEVEAQVYELLSRKSGAEPVRADVLAVLAALDPPEAYAPEPYRHRVSENVGTPIIRMRRPQPSLLALCSAGGGVLAMFLAMLLVILMSVGDYGELALILGAAFFVPVALAVTTCGILSIVRIRRSDGWLFGLRAALFAAILFPLLMGNGILILAGFVLQGYGFIGVSVLAVLACNAFLVYHLWKLVASGYRRAMPVPERME